MLHISPLSLPVEWALFHYDQLLLYRSIQDGNYILIPIIITLNILFFSCKLWQTMSYRIFALYSFACFLLFSFHRSGWKGSFWNFCILWYTLKFCYNFCVLSLSYCSLCCGDFYCSLKTMWLLSLSLFLWLTQLLILVKILYRFLCFNVVLCFFYLI